MHQWTRELNIIAHNHFLQSALNTWKCLLEVKYIWICTSSFFFQSEFKVMSDTQEQENKEREYKNETTVWTKGQIERSGSQTGHILLNHFKPSYKYQHLYHRSDTVLPWQTLIQPRNHTSGAKYRRTYFGTNFVDNVCVHSIANLFGFHDCYINAMPWFFFRLSK